LVCFLIHTQPDPYPVVSTIEEAAGKCKSSDNSPVPENLERAKIQHLQIMRYATDSLRQFPTWQAV